MKENEHQKEENSKSHKSSRISKIAKNRTLLPKKMKNGKTMNPLFVAAATLGLNLNQMGPKSTILAQQQKK